MPVGEAWSLLNRIEDITPCLPGATAIRVTDDRYDIVMKIRFGPLDLMFKGAVDITQRDPATHTLAVKTKANDAKGQGSASGATVATMSEEAGITRVVLDTDLMIGGRIAQMGRGMVADVSNELLGRFVGNLKTRFLAASQAKAGTDTPAAAADPSPAAVGAAPVPPEVRAAPAGQAEEYVDVGGAVRRAMWRRLINLIFFWRKSD